MARDRREQWQGEVTNELRHIAQRLTAFDQRLERLDHQLTELIAQHLNYHAENEHRWGLFRWAQRYPFRFAVLLAGLILWIHGPDTSFLSGLVRDALLHLSR